MKKRPIGESGWWHFRRVPLGYEFSYFDIHFSEKSPYQTLAPRSKENPESATDPFFRYITKWAVTVAPVTIIMFSFWH